MNASMHEALELLDTLASQRDGRSRAVFFVNAHTLNVACHESGYREVLLSAEQVFGDGTGVRWAVRLLHGRRLKENVNGTDLVPLFLRVVPGRGRRYFMLGSSPEAIGRAAEHARAAFPGWTLAGCHHGYLDATSSAAVVDQIRAARPDLLLVGMGNPRQERWIHRHRDRLEVPLCIAIGGLFDYWAGDLQRAPTWLRRTGFEWVHLMLHQPRKLSRYLIGNPAFLMRVARRRWLERGVDPLIDRGLGT
jgi:N-acetylglucosaminyldiphosphoundecaprenol N-acetyl-beta-D-mannosaminyltransferase